LIPINPVLDSEFNACAVLPGFWLFLPKTACSAGSRINQIFLRLIFSQYSLEPCNISLTMLFEP